MKHVLTPARQRAVCSVLEALPLEKERIVAGYGDTDLVVRTTDGQSLSIEVKHLSTVRREDLLGRLAHAVLKVRQVAGRKAHHLIVVVTPHLSTAMVNTTRAFMREHAPEIDWSLVGENGDLVVEAPGLGVERKLQLRQRDRSSSTHKTPGQPFSDLNAWMLKVLLLAEVDERRWGGPNAKVASASELAIVAGVSEPHAYRFVRTFTEMDHLRRTADGLAIVQRRRLVESWFEATRLAPRKTAPVRWMLGAPADPQEVFAVEDGGIFKERAFDVDLFGDSHREDNGGRSKIALAGYEACRELGVLHTDSHPREVHISSANLPAILATYALELCEVRDAHFSLILSESESVFRGVVRGHGEVACVDLLQAALDVVVHPARGREQAEYIVHDVLQWGNT